MPSASQRPRLRLRTGRLDRIGAGIRSPALYGRPAPQLWRRSSVRSSGAPARGVGPAELVVAVGVAVPVVVRVVVVAVATLQPGRVERLRQRQQAPSLPVPCCTYGASGLPWSSWNCSEAFRSLSSALGAPRARPGHVVGGLREAQTAAVRSPVHALAAPATHSFWVYQFRARRPSAASS